MMPNASKSEVDLLLQYYPDDPSAGCPFDTGIRNILGTFNFDLSWVDWIEITFTRSSVQANRGNTRGHYIPRSSPVAVEKSGQQAGLVGFQYVRVRVLEPITHPTFFSLQTWQRSPFRWGGEGVTIYLPRTELNIISRPTAQIS
jgi:hypothetical protein